MKIGDVTLSDDGEVFFFSKCIGKVARFYVNCVGKNRSGHLSMLPSSKDADLEEIANSLAPSGIGVSFDFYGEFWPSSYIKDGKWYIEKKPGEVKCLSIAAPEQDQAEVFPDDSMTGVY